MSYLGFCWPAAIANPAPEASLRLSGTIDFGDKPVDPLDRLVDALDHGKAFG